MSLVKTNSKRDHFKCTVGVNAGIRALTTRSKWTYSSILPKKKAYSKILEEMEDAAMLI